MKLTKRGKRVKSLAIGLGILTLLALALLISSRLWSTDRGYCWGSMAKCYGGSGL